MDSLFRINDLFNFLKTRLTEIRVLTLLLFIYLIYFIFWWTYKLDILPGLHGDEAWFGLKAIEIQENGLDRLYGMNTYTGVFQECLSSWSFNWFGKGVFQLRIVGVVFNLIGLIILMIVFGRQKQRKIILVLFLLIGQSVFLIISPRIAWEVNSFTLFFISLLSLTVSKITTAQKPLIKNSYAFLFLFINILGTYNHIIFSCISIAAMLGLILWSLHYRSLRYKNLIILGLINAFNLVILYFTMSNYLYLLSSLWGFLFLIIFLFLFIELCVFRYLSGIQLRKIELKINPLISILLPAIFLCFFLYFHGLAVFQVFTNNKVLLHFFSYRTTFFQSSIFNIVGCFHAGVFCLFLINDIRFHKESVFAWIILSYLGLFSFYTTDCSSRYYLSIFILVNIYIGIKLTQSSKALFLLFIVMLVTTTILTCNVLAEVFENPDRSIKPLYFDMGNGKMETTAHFISNKPVIDFLRKKHISRIIYRSNQYFLEQPIEFYNKIDPWIQSADSVAILDYNFRTFGNGFLIYTTSFKNTNNL